MNGSAAMSEDIFLTVEEVSKRLSVHEETVRRWIRRGELEAIDLQGPAGYRINQSELNRFIRGRATKRKDP
jgi:excisionase family DNA binding protein